MLRHTPSGTANGCRQKRNGKRRQGGKAAGYTRGEISLIRKMPEPQRGYCMSSLARETCFVTQQRLMNLREIRALMGFMIWPGMSWSGQTVGLKGANQRLLKALPGYT